MVFWENFQNRICKWFHLKCLKLWLNSVSEGFCAVTMSLSSDSRGWKTPIDHPGLPFSRGSLTGGVECTSQFRGPRQWLQGWQGPCGAFMNTPRSTAPWHQLESKSGGSVMTCYHFQPFPNVWNFPFIKSESSVPNITPWIKVSHSQFPEC